MTRSTRLPRPGAAARLLAALATAALAAPARAQDTDAGDGPPPLYAHTDDGPVTVMHGASRERLPLEETRQAVQGYVGQVNDLLARGADAPVKALEEAIARGRALQETKTALTGTLYLEEAIRRLKRERLARVPVEDTQVHAQYAQQYAARFAKPVVLRRGADDLGVSYATLAACLELADVPNAKPPHKVRVEPDGTLWTRLNGTPLALDLVEFQDGNMLLRSIVLGTSRSLGFKDKAQVARMLLDTCV
jgi:hypothetical protein